MHFYKKSYTLYKVGTLLFLSGCFTPNPKPPTTVTDTFYNPEGEEVGKVSVTPSPSGSGERSTFKYSGDEGSAHGTVTTSDATGSPVETFYDSKGKQLGSSSMSNRTGTSTKTFYDSDGEELGNVSSDPEVEEK